MLLLTGIFCLIVGVWVGRKWKRHQFNQYKREMVRLLQKAEQLHSVNKALTKEVKLHRKAIRVREIEEMRMGVIDAAAELMVEA